MAMRRLIPSACLCCLSALSMAAPPAGLWLPSLFGDHMVVQSGRRVRVWGRDAPGATVRVSLSLDGPAPAAPLESAAALAGPDGAWSAALPALPVGGPYQLLVQGSGVLRCRDVLSGEVWLGSGQSNMEMPLRATRGAAGDLAASGLPSLRLFTVAPAAALTDREDVAGRWQVCGPGTARDFSGVAFHFGRELSAALGRPVGMIVASWGGTPGEDWSPRRALDADPATRKLMAAWDRAPGAARLAAHGSPFHLELAGLRWVKAGGALDRRSADGMGEPLPLDGWSGQGGPFSQGRLSRTAEGLAFDGWVQGTRPSAAVLPLRAAWGWRSSRDLGADRFLAFRVRGSGVFDVALAGPGTDGGFHSRNFEATPGWRSIWIPLGGFFPQAWGPDAPLDLAHVSALSIEVPLPSVPLLGGALYHGMIAPLRRYPMQGVLWYQGESNSGRAGDYATLLRGLVRGWRRAWGEPDLAFLAVQLPRLRADGHWAQLREAQARALGGLSRAGLAVSLDAGESLQIHPRDKKTVGHRLALVALSVAYGRPVEASGPVAGALALGRGRLRLSLAHAQGLRLAVADPASFEVASRDLAFHRAQVTVEGAGLWLWSPAVPRPWAARYAWCDDPEVDLYNGAGLPAAPFSVQLPR